jgi:hypothetical protein
LIVGQMFENDDDDELAWKQHDVYDQALIIIVSCCNQLVSFAKSVLQDTVHDEWGTCNHFDHRVLQGAHDTLAAAWRFRNDARQFTLPFDPPSKPVPAEERWREWLRHEVMAWIDHPDLVRFVQIILCNQNKPLGYAAEARLCLDLMHRFPDVPWQNRWKQAYRADLSKHSADLQEGGEQLKVKPKVAGECECTRLGQSCCNQIPCKTTIKRAAREGWGPLE